MFQRQQVRELQKRIEGPRSNIQVLVGPRQVGKTTLVNQLLKEVTVRWAFESADAIPAGTPQWIEQL